MEIAKCLINEYSVSIAAPSVKLKDTAGVELFQFCSEKFHAHVSSASIIIIQGDALRTHPFLKNCSAVLIADLYCPVQLEYHQVSDGIDSDIRIHTSAYLAETLREQLAYADHFICASERQRNYWLGALTSAGRINALRWPKASHANVEELISLLPFGLADDSPSLERRALREMFNIPSDDFVLVWGGGIYQWFDPLTIIRAVHRLIQNGNKVHLVFIGVKHPNPDIQQHNMCTQALSLAEELGLEGKYVHFNFGWVDYGDRHNYLLDADIGVSAHFHNPETIFSFRTRILDYLWCALPIISTKGDFFGDKLLEEQCGISVDYESTDDWVNAIESLIKNPEKLRNLREGSRRYSQQFRWRILVSKLADRCRNISPSPDRKFIRSSFISSPKPTFIRRLKAVFARGGITALFSTFFRRLKANA